MVLPRFNTRRTAGLVAGVAGLAALHGQAPAPSLVPVMAQDILDLGPVDSGSLGHGVVRIANFGTRTFHLTPPGNPGIRNLRVAYPSSLAIVPGGSAEIDLYGDFHGGAGEITGSVRILTDDPGAASIPIQVHARVASTTDVRPYRDAVFASRDASGTWVCPTLDFEFFPGNGGGKFIQAWVEDVQAPLLLAGSRTPSGGLHGTLQLDPARAPALGGTSGETRVLGITDGGQRNFFWVQWLVKP